MKTRKVIQVLGMACLFTGNLLASSKTQEFKAPIEQVWKACVQAAAEKFALKFSDKDSKVLTFATGASMRSWGMDASVTLKETDEGKIEVSVTPQKSKELWSTGAGGSVAKKYFKAVEENLRKLQSMPPSVAEK